MSKKFVTITQTYNTVAIMDIDENETYEDIQERIKKYLDNNGGAEAVIDYGGYIEHEILTDTEPDEDDEEQFECIE